MRLGYWLLIILSLFAPMVAANPAAHAWLDAQAQIGGSYERPDDIATPTQATAETLRTLRALDQTGYHANPASLLFLDASANQGVTEYLARALIAHTETGGSAADLLTALEANQNSDGGFGSASGFSSNVLDTAFALEALVKAVGSHATVVSAAVGYLQSHQNSDGSYTLDSTAHGATYTTATALMALHASRLYYNLTQQITKTVSFLLSAQNSTGGWGSDFESSWALLALASATTDLTPLMNAAQSLKNMQMPDGSWGQDVYRTALAARALTVIQEGPVAPPPESDTDAIIAGFVTDAEHGTPIIGANITVTGSDSISAVTNALGAYRIVAPPVFSAITASAPGFLDATASASLTAGTTLTFSPGLLADSATAPTTTRLIGKVEDASTGQALAGVEIAVAGGSTSSVTDATGKFLLADLTPGDWVLDVNLTGYQNMQVTLTAAVGTSDLGTIRLSPIAANGNTLVGIVTDSATGTPLIDAVVAIGSEGKSVRTAADGSFRIEGIAQTIFSINVSATGYLSRQSQASLTQSGLFTLNMALDRAAAADFDIDSLLPKQAGYPAYSKIEVQAHLINGSAVERKVRLYGVIVDGGGQIIEQFPARTAPLGDDPTGALETVPANGDIVAVVDWHNGVRTFGWYDFIVQAYDGESGQLLAERSTPIEVLATHAIGGSVEFDPPIAQLAAQQPVSLTALVSNRGNLDLDGGTITAKISLKNPGYQTNNSLLETQTLAQGNGLSLPRGIDRDNAGNLYAVNYATGTLVKVNAAGAVTVVATGFSSLVDIDIAPNGDIYVLNSSSYERLATDGSRQKVLTGWTGQQAIEVLADKSIYIAASTNGVYSITPAGSKTKLPLTGLGNASEIQSDAQGTLYIGDSTNGTIFRLASGNVLETIQTGLPSLENFAIAPNGSIAAVYSTKKLAFFAPDGTRREITDTLPLTVRGSVWDADGRIVLCVDLANALLKLYPPTPPSDIGTGEVVHTSTVQLPSLPLGSAAVTLDFGAWTPTSSGDFQVELAVDPHPEYGSLFNTLHVGSNAHGAFSVNTPTVRTGDQANAATISLFGADSTSITHIDPTGTTLTATSKTNGRGIAADTQGNIYATNASTVSSIVRVTPAGAVSTFVSGYTFGTELVIDINDNLYSYATTNPATVLKITPNGEVAPLVTLGGSIKGLAIGQDEQLYAVDGSNSLTRIHLDGQIELVTKNGISNARGLTIDANGYFYILTSNSGNHLDEDGVTRFYNKILRITPDGKRYSDYHTQAVFEFEGFNVTADCSNNLLFAPRSDYPFKTSGEENVILQVVGDTGEERQVLYGPSIDPAMSDMDVLYYDRFGKRLLIWTDLNQGKIFSFPVVCGGIDADVHLITRGDAEVTGMTPASNQTTDLGNNSFEHVWNLIQIDDRGVQLQLDLLLKGLTENEIRPVAQEAYVEFHNSFVPGQKVRTPLDIPNVLATNAMQIQPGFDASQYGPLAPVNIHVDVVNGGAQAFSGILQLSIVDAAGFPVQDLPPIAVTDQAGPSTLVYPAEWNTSLFLVGDYHLVANLLDESGATIATGSAPFAIVYETNIPSLDATLNPDKLMYAGWDQVNLGGSITNTATNALLSATVATIQVAAPDGKVIYTHSVEIGELTPGALRDLNFNLNLSDAASGDYPVTLTVKDAASGAILITRTTQLRVIRQAVQALAGTVAAVPVKAYQGDPVQCTETVNYQSSTPAAAVKLTSRLVNMDTGQVITETTRTVAMSSDQTQTDVRSISTGNLAVGAYACLLSGEIDGIGRTLAMAGFDVQTPPIRVDAELRVGDHGRVLALLDNAPDKCIGITKLNLETVLAAPLTAAAHVDVKLYDTQGLLIDSESAGPDARNVNKNGVKQAIGLTIEDFSSNHLSVQIDGAKGLTSDVKITAHITDTGLDVNKSSGAVTAVCPAPVTVGGVYGDFRLTAVQRLSLADDPLAFIHTPSLSIQKQTLETLLSQAGWSYTLVTDEANFGKQLHTGGYAAYMLLSAQIKLDEPMQKELREAVYRGEGLIEAGSNDQRQGRIDDILGIKFLGKHPGMGGITVLPSAAHNPGSALLALTDKTLKASSLGADILGNFSNTEEPAMTSRQYGAGKADYFGFDLLAEASMPDADPLYADLLLGALEHVHPATLKPFAGGAYPLQLLLTNQGMAVSGQAVLGLPAGVGVIDKGSATVLDNTLTWPFALIPGQTQAFDSWLSLPSTPVQISALIQTGVSPELKDHATVTLNITPLAASTLEELLADAQTLDPVIYKQVIKYLQWAVQDQQSGNVGNALASLIRASDALVDIGPGADGELRTHIAEAMRALAQKL
jgi:sugar lactone lactonase YvrE